METDHIKKLKMHKLISILITVPGILLMAYMIIVEDEPGAIPLGLIIVGTVWYFLTRYKVRSLQS